MSSRERILTKVRAGVAAGAPRLPGDAEAARRTTVEQRLAGHERNLIPARAAGKSPAELVAVMRRWLELAGADVIEVPAAETVPAAVGGYLRRHNLPQRIRMGEDPGLAALPWQIEPQLAIDRGAADRVDTASVTAALAAVAETGTLVVPSGPANPVTLSFLPEANIVVVSRQDIVGPLEDAIARVRARPEAATGMPRTLNLISGPSRSADIGGIPVFGAHGPRRLCVIVVGPS